jgi:hypothetical protein
MFNRNKANSEIQSLFLLTSAIFKLTLKVSIQELEKSGERKNNFQILTSSY